MTFFNGMKVPSSLMVLEICQSYVDDAAQFPEQFKPGVVKAHQKAYAQAQADLAELLLAIEPFARHNSSEATVPVALNTKDVTRLRSALARVEGVA